MLIVFEATLAALTLNDSIFNLEIATNDYNYFNQRNIFMDWRFFSQIAIWPQLENAILYFIFCWKKKITPITLTICPFLHLVYPTKLWLWSFTMKTSRKNLNPSSMQGPNSNKAEAEPIQSKPCSSPTYCHHDLVPGSSYKAKCGKSQANRYPTND